MYDFDPKLSVFHVDIINVFFLFGWLRPPEKHFLDCPCILTWGFHAHPDIIDCSLRPDVFRLLLVSVSDGFRLLLVSVFDGFRLLLVIVFVVFGCYWFAFLNQVLASFSIL